MESFDCTALIQISHTENQKTFWHQFLESAEHLPERRRRGGRGREGGGWVGGIGMVARGLHEGGVRLKGGVRGMWMGGEW